MNPGRKFDVGSLSGQAWLLLVLVLLVGAAAWLVVLRNRRAVVEPVEPPADPAGVPMVDATMPTPPMGMPAVATGPVVETAAAGEATTSEPVPVEVTVEAVTEEIEEPDETAELAVLDEPADQISEEPAAQPAAVLPEAATEPEPEPDVEPAASAPFSAMQSLEKLPPVFAMSRAADQPPESPYGPGSAQPNPDGSAPSDEYRIKGNADSMLYHTTDSPYYGRTRPAVWFRSEADAKRAGFAPWNRRTRQQARTAARQAKRS